MAGFWFFIPEVSERDLLRAGRIRWPDSSSLSGTLADCVSQDHVVLQPLRATALGSAGLAVYPVPSHKRIPANPGYCAESQTWRRIPGSELQIGWLTDEPPRPEDLVRLKQVDGRAVTDDAGNEWTVPVARARWNPRGTLPAAYTFDADDNPIVGVSAPYRAFWENACKLWDLIGAATAINGEDMIQRFRDEDEAFCWQMIQDALTINYRVDRHVLATLELIYPGWLGRDVARLMLNSICDGEAYRLYFDAQKKTNCRSEADGLPSTPGGPGDIPALNPA